MIWLIVQPLLDNWLLVWSLSLSLTPSPSLGFSLLATGIGATAGIWILQKKEVVSNAEKKEHSEA